MSPEERLNKLAERVDAIAHSLELLAAMQIESEKRVARLEQSMTTLADGMSLLTRVAIDHGERIEGLEGNRPQLCPKPRSE